MCPPQTDPPQLCSQVSPTAVSYENMNNDVKNVLNCNLINGIIPIDSGIQENASNSNPQAVVNSTKTCLVEKASPSGIKKTILIVADNHGRGFTED
ncbi:hypothetical protein QE152_g28992 [Popillia japonica]|uniref:Uncharacterized protein n=1 Tax=Popillia japonica TaxID=7064 RepID=A0AAW1JIK9_POPJA